MIDDVFEYRVRQLGQSALMFSAARPSEDQDQNQNDQDECANSYVHRVPPLCPWVRLFAVRVSNVLVDRLSHQSRVGLPVKVLACHAAEISPQ